MNYARMEEVWRSYGPLEAIGPEEARRKGRRRGAAVAGVIAVVVAGAGAGLYLQPDLEERGRSDRQTATREPARVNGPPSGVAPLPQSATLSEADALEAQLQLAVADGAAPLTPSPPPSGPVLLPDGRSFQPPAREQPRGRPTILRPRVDLQSRLAPRRPAPASGTAEGPIRSMAVPERPLVTASLGSPMRSYPREAPPLRPAPRLPAPEPAAASAPPPAPAGPDCRRAGNAADRMVCESPDLAALDRRMEVELAGAVAAGHSRNLLLRDQNDWRARRDAAAPDPRAVADAYRRRIGQLRSMQ